MKWFRFYQGLIWLSFPILKGWIYYRAHLGKEDQLRIKERFGETAQPRPSGTVIWFHSASVGETISILPLLEKIQKAYPNYHFLLTTTTVTSAKLVATKFPTTFSHQFLPIDYPKAVRRFLNHWRPHLAIWVESEFWPVLTYYTSACCPLISLNTRISYRSFRFWQRFPSLIRWMLARFTLFFPQSSLDAHHLKKLGANDKIIHLLGNLKYASATLPFEASLLEFYQQQFKDRIIWIAASTHPSEEKMIAEIHKELKKAFPDLLTLIAPRHPTRTSEILNEFKELEVSVITRSSKLSITEHTDIFLVDTLGELGLFYQLCPISFIGGSFINHGGHNILEPARLNCTVIFGPFVSNFEEMCAQFLTKNAACQVENSHDLKKLLHELFSTPSLQANYSKAALMTANEYEGIIDKICDQLTPYLNPR